MLSSHICDHQHDNHATMVRDLWQISHVKTQLLQVSCVYTLFKVWGKTKRNLQWKFLVYMSHVFLPHNFLTECNAIASILHRMHECIGWGVRQNFQSKHKMQMLLMVFTWTTQKFFLLATTLFWLKFEKDTHFVSLVQ